MHQPEGIEVFYFMLRYSVNTRTYSQGNSIAPDRCIIRKIINLQAPVLRREMITCSDKGAYKRIEVAGSYRYTLGNARTT